MFIVEPDIVSVPEAPPMFVLVKLISEGLLLEKFNKFGVVNLKPLAFSYDWGMLTDLGRRNQSRVCGKLGIEHIIISADIRKKKKKY